VTNAGRILDGKCFGKNLLGRPKKRDRNTTLRRNFRRSAGVESGWSCFRIATKYGLRISGDELPGSATISGRIGPSSVRHSEAGKPSQQVRQD